MRDRRVLLIKLVPARKISYPLPAGPQIRLYYKLEISPSGPAFHRPYTTRNANPPARRNAQGCRAHRGRR